MAFPPVLSPVLYNETGKRLIFQIDYDVIRRTGQHGLLGHVERVGFNVVNIGGNEEEVPWTGVYVLFNVHLAHYGKEGEPTASLLYPDSLHSSTSRRLARAIAS